MRIACTLIFIVLTAFGNATPPIVAFLGPKKVGKDTCADYLVEAYGYKKYALADPMKHAVQNLFHFSDEQMWGDQKDLIDPFWGVSPREVMQYIGVDTLYEGLGHRFPHLGHSFFIRALERWQTEHPEIKVAICDLRMQEDVIALKKMGAHIIRLERPGIIVDDSHISEGHVYEVEGYDSILINEGTLEDLYKKIDDEIRKTGNTAQ